MFNRPTTFVIGAGCRCEYGLPLGETLKEQIAVKLENLRHPNQRRDHDYGSFMILGRTGADT